MTTALEIRCPTGPKKLLAKVLASGGTPTLVPGAPLIEFACNDCARLYRRDNPRVTRVLHRYAFTGEWVETETEISPDRL